MNTTIGEAIQRVQSLYSKGVQSKDSRLTDRHIYSCLCTSRSTILQQKSNKDQFISTWNYQTLPCVPLELAPLHECPCAPQGITMLRSKERIPKIISGIDSTLMLSLSTLDNSLSFDYKEFDTFKYTKGRKYTSTKPFYFFRNGYVYLGNIKTIPAIPVVGMFHDPVEAYLYPSCEECEECLCKEPYDMEFPIDGELLKPIVEMTYQETLQIFSQMKEDRSNNASDDGDSKGTMVHG
jgi:hypothetical protein